MRVDRQGAGRYIPCWCWLVRRFGLNLCKSSCITQLRANKPFSGMGSTTYWARTCSAADPVLDAFRVFSYQAPCHVGIPGPAVQIQGGKLERSRL